MKTIKQVADEIGVSKTAVRKKIENLGLHSSLQKDGNQFVIDERQESLIKSAFGEKETETKEETKTDTVSTLVSMLQRELDAKNEQIIQLQKLLDQEQQLRLVTERKMLQLEEKQEEPEPKKRFWGFGKRSREN